MNLSNSFQIPQKCKFKDFLRKKYNLIFYHNATEFFKKYLFTIVEKKFLNNKVFKVKF